MRIGTVPVVAPPPELTDASIEAFERAVRPHVESDAPGLVLDLEGVRFVNSTGLGCFVQIGMELDASGRPFALARAERRVERVIRLIGLDSILPLFRSLEEASEYVASASPS